MTAVGKAMEVGGVYPDIRGIQITNNAGSVSIVTGNSQTVVMDLYFSNGSIEALTTGGGGGGIRSTLFSISGSFFSLWMWGDEFRIYNNFGYANNVTIPHTLKSSNRYRLVVTRVASNVSLYVNGQKLGSGTIGGQQGLSETYQTTFFTRNTLAGNGFYGTGYEVKIYNIAQDANWVLNDYNEASRYW
jgi:hypothetical protein